MSPPNPRKGRGTHLRLPLAPALGPTSPTHADFLVLGQTCPLPPRLQRAEEADIPPGVFSRPPLLNSSMH